VSWESQGGPKKKESRKGLRSSQAWAHEGENKRRERAATGRKGQARTDEGRRSLGSFSSQKTRREAELCKLPMNEYEHEHKQGHGNSGYLTESLLQ
jgi:hypothetical protein